MLLHVRGAFLLGRLSLLCVCLSTSVNVVAQTGSIESMDLGIVRVTMRSQGMVVQTARACGISESAMQGMQERYATALALADAVQQTPLLSKATKQKVGTSTELQASFLAGAQSIADKPAPSSAGCAKLKSLWPGLDRGAAASAQKDKAYAAQIKNASR